MRSLAAAWRPPADSTVTGRPLLNESFALNHAWTGFEVWSYHAVNLAIHLTAAWVLFAVLRKLIGRADVACAAAMLWGAHPLLTEAVTYVSQRAESLMGLFYLVTLWAFLERRWAVSVAACAAGMLTKETMVTAPVVVWLIDRTFRTKEARGPWGLYVALAATWLPLIWLMRGLGERGVGWGSGVSPWAYALTEAGAVLHYLRLAMWPHPLVFDYGAGIAPHPVAAVVVAVGAVAALVAWWRGSELGCAALAGLALLGPTSSVLPIAGQPVAEHRMYLPLAALAAVLAVAIFRWCGRAAWSVVGALAVMLVCLTWARNRSYRTALELWAETAARVPENARAQNNLGEALNAAGDSAGAETRFRRAVALNPHYPEAHSNLSAVLAARGAVAAALSEAQAAVALSPQLASAQFNLGNALRMEGSYSAAIAAYHDALELHPTDAEAWNNLGIAQAQSGDRASAEESFQKAIAANPRLAPAECNLANILRDRGDVAGAIEHYRKAISIDPNYRRAQLALQALER